MRARFAVRKVMVITSALMAVGLMAGVGAAGDDADVIEEGLTAWFDASDYDGEAGVWADASGNGNDALPVDEDHLPGHDADGVNGQPVVTFAGEAFLKSEPFEEPLAQPNTIFVVGQLDPSAHSLSYLYDGLSDGERHALNTVDGGDWWSVWAGDRGQTRFVPDSGWNVFTAHYDEASSSLRVNGVTDGPVDAGPEPMGGITIAGRFNENRLEGAIAEILVYDRALDDGERDTVEGYLRSKYDIDEDVDPRARGAGTEDRDWVEQREPDPTPPAEYDFDTEENVGIEMRDGTTLDAKLYLPDFGDEGPGPCVLVANGYGRESGPAQQYFPRLEMLAEHGYAGVHMSYRGTGDSEGEETLYNQYGPDGYDAVEWMAEQDWCDGNVGMFGSSLVGLNQWQVARENPPSLKAIVPDVGCGDCYEYLWYPGGMDAGPGRVGRGHPEYTHARQHRNFDDWWRERTTLAEDHEQMVDDGIAIMATGGWQDYISAGNVQAFEEFALAGGVGKLMMHPGAHSPGRGDINGPYHYDEHMIMFFERHLRGEDNEFSDRGQALFWVNGPDEWRYEENWPIADARAARLHLREAASGSIDSLNDGSLTAVAPRPNEASVGYDYDAEDGPFLPTRRNTGTGGITNVDMAPYESEVLTWTTGELEEATEVTGKYEMEFFAEADVEDTDFVLMISDVAPDGTSRQVTSGYLSAPRNDSRAEPDPLEPGEVRQYHIDTQAMSWVFNEGHRIRFSLAGGTKNADDDRSGSEQGPAQNPNDASVTIHQDAARPGTVEMPVIGTAFLPTEDDPTSRQDCLGGGWEDYGFANQGQCLRYVEAGQDSR